MELKHQEAGDAQPRVLNYVMYVRGVSLRKGPRSRNSHGTRSVRRKKSIAVNMVIKQFTNRMHAIIRKVASENSTGIQYQV